MKSKAARFRKNSSTRPKKALKKRVDKGILAGYPVVDVEVTLYDGSFHEVDSSEAAFKIAGSMAFQEAAQRAKPVILEPIMKIQVIVPDNFMGEVTGNVNCQARPHRIHGRPPGPQGHQRKNSAFRNLRLCDRTCVPCPRAAVQFTMEFDHYEPAPNNVAQLIIEGKKR